MDCALPDETESVNLYINNKKNLLTHNQFVWYAQKTKRRKECLESVQTILLGGGAALWIEYIRFLHHAAPIAQSNRISQE